MNWKRWGVIVGILLTVWTWQQWPEGRLRIVFCDVGQGDGAVIVLGAFQALIDTGPSETKMAQCIADNVPFWDREIEVVLLSHGDKDHAGALKDLKKDFHINKVIEKADRKDVIRYGMLSFEILSGNDNDSRDLESAMLTDNQGSLVVKLTYGSFTALFTGDIDVEVELALKSMGVLKNIDLLKVAHHGSKFSSGKEFLGEVRPELAVISVGSKNTYGHPHGDTLMRLDAVGAKVLRTDQMGTISVVTDGSKIEVYKNK